MRCMTAAEPRDLRGRALRDLRVSVTDRCNFRCTYCMPRELFGADHAFLDRSELLTFEEIARTVRITTGIGVRKIRLTGGEPLLRQDLDRLVAMIAAVDGIEDIALTTNGSLLAQHAERLRAAGLQRVTVSLDALDEATFQAMSDVRIPIQRVLEGIEAATAAGFAPVKLNAVIRRGVNEDQIVDLAAFGRDRGLVVRFIEYMDVGTTNGWRLDEVLPSAEVVERVAAAFPADPVGPAADAGGSGAVAERWRYRDGQGEFGVISSVTRPFCSTCTRARLSAIGELFTCLFAATGRDVRALLRGGASDEEIGDFVAGTWRARDDAYSQHRTAGTSGLPRVEMSYIGG
jgi:GTP 3',8-cyclase